MISVLSSFSFLLLCWSMDDYTAKVVVVPVPHPHFKKSIERFWIIVDRGWRRFMFDGGLGI